jgi:pantothenate kinase-related protein Tda10
MASPVNKDAVYQISKFIEHQIKKQQPTTSPISLIVGLNGPQGIGKYTIDM